MDVVVVLPEHHELRSLSVTVEDGYSSLKATYCWWTKSCTTKDDDYPIIYRFLTIPGGAGFRPSTGTPLNLRDVFRKSFARKHLPAVASPGRFQGVSVFRCNLTRRTEMAATQSGAEKLMMNFIQDLSWMWLKRERTKVLKEWLDDLASRMYIYIYIINHIGS